ncbi:sugar porter family MFS transporter [Erwinia tracheiphila]|uniref:MFS transporter n=1 Tax=Erwinia tracheiphila TaxID=65700 RepID=UPI001F1C8C23|nr:MFS transporter [Erwinia tracheiphila]UIA83796.1 sugar porter family MFS transporter [Erwinia tracheiphila]UIA92379.1 sugar porter family MFS transporter [Erwinia tracheiphila]
MHGRDREARDILERTRHSRMVERKMAEIRQSMGQKSQKNSRRQKTISMWMKRLVAPGIGIAMLQQLSGVNTIMFYAPTMLQATDSEPMPHCWQLLLTA